MGGSGAFGLQMDAAKMMADRLAIMAARQSTAWKTVVYMSWSQWVVVLSLGHIFGVCITGSRMGLLDCMGFAGVNRVVVIIMCVVVIIGKLSAMASSPFAAGCIAGCSAGGG